MIKTIFREANKPEPIEKIDSSGTVKWGTDNLYPQFLNSIYYNNPVHGGIINQKVKFITAGGIDTDSVDKSILDNGGSAYTLQEVIESCTRDYEIGETYCILFKKKVDGEWYADPVDFELIRATEDGTYYEYSDNWKGQQSLEKTGYRKIKSIFKVGEEDLECILVNITRPKQQSIGEGRKATLTCNYYPSVNYSGAITSIMAGIEMDYFTYSEVVNGYKGGVLINMANGKPVSDDVEDKIVNDLKANASARETQGGITVTFSNGKDNAPEISQMNGNDLDKRYIESNKEIVKKIMYAHGVISPALFGLASEGMFGSKEEMETAYVLFQQNYVKSRQRNISEPITWAFKKLNGFDGVIFFNEYNISLEQNIVTEDDNTGAVSEAINGMSPLVATKVLNAMTINEVRALGQLEPLPNGNVPSGGVGQFSSEVIDDEDLLNRFANCGVPRSTKKIEFSASFDANVSDDDFKAQYIKSKFATDLTKEQQLIVKMIKEGATFPQVSKAVGKGGNYLSKQLITLGNNGIIDGWRVTEEGNTDAVVEAEIEVLYSYEKKANAPDLVKGGKSRDFCKTLIELDRLYTRSEIDTISKNVKRDVWTYRGGWYHNPDTNRNTPSCRHEWKVNVVSK